VRSKLDGGPWLKLPSGIVIKASSPMPSCSRSSTPGRIDVIATLNLNGDYMSDALAAQVGESGSHRSNINYESGHAVFEATHEPRQVRRAGQVIPAR